MTRWIVYAARMIDYKLIGWRWHFHPPHPRPAFDEEHER
jgi:hypothetical protein